MNDITLFNPEIIEKNNEVWTTSLEIAEKFGRRHDTIIRKIKNLSLSVPKDLKLHTFVELEVPKLGGTQKYYLVSKKGFMLIVVSFTGRKANEWKIKFIEAFDQMVLFVTKKKYQRLNDELNDRLNNNMLLPAPVIEEYKESLTDAAKIRIFHQACRFLETQKINKNGLHTCATHLMDLLVSWKIKYPV